MHITLSAVAYRNRSLLPALDAAQAAGYSGVGLTLGGLTAAIEQGTRVEDVRDEILSRGLTLDEFELFKLSDSVFDGQWNELVSHATEVLQPRRLHITSMNGDPARAADQFAAACESIPAGPLIAYEFMPYGSVKTLQDAVDLVEKSSSTRARLVLDAFHLFRSGGDVTDITEDVMRLVDGVQLCDLVPRGPGVGIVHESRHLRTLPGWGTLPVNELLQRVISSSHRPTITVEAHSDALDAMPLPFVLEMGYQAVRQSIARAEETAVSSLVSE